MHTVVISGNAAEVGVALSRKPSTTMTQFHQVACNGEITLHFARKYIQQSALEINYLIETVLKQTLLKQ